VRHYRPIAGLSALCGVSTEDTWWSHPIDYKLAWTDKCSGSGAKLGITVYTRDFAGMPLLYATPVYPPDPQEAFLATLEVPAALQTIREAD
jgi:hypothetical protein